MGGIFDVGNMNLKANFKLMLPNKGEHYLTKECFKEYLAKVNNILINHLQRDTVKS